jgi:hypothetical protein
VRIGMTQAGAEQRGFGKFEQNCHWHVRGFFWHEARSNERNNRRQSEGETGAVDVLFDSHCPGKRPGKWPKQPY